MTARLSRRARLLRAVWPYWVIALMIVLALGLTWLTDGTRRNRVVIRAVQQRGGFSLRDERIVAARPPRPRTSPLHARIESEFIDRLPTINLDGARLTDSDLQEIGRAAGVLRFQANGTTIDDAGLRHLAGLRDLQELELSETTIGDAGMAHLTHLPQLQKLLLYQTRVGDEVGNVLKTMVKLEELHLGRTAVGNATLAQLAGLTALRELRLQHTRVTDSGLAHVAKLVRLVALDLTGTDVSDAGLQHLKDLPELRLLILEDTRVTDQGVARLKEAQPAVQVWRSRGGFSGVGTPPIWYPDRRNEDCWRPEDATAGEHALCTKT